MKMQDNFNNLRKLILYRLEQYCSNCLALEYNHCKECGEKDFSFEELKDLMFFYYIYLRKDNCSIDCAIVNNLNKCIGKDFETDFEWYYNALITGSKEHTKEFRQAISRKVLFYFYLIMLHLDGRYNVSLTRNEFKDFYKIDFYKKCFSDYKCDWDCIMNIPIVIPVVPQPPIVEIPECEPIRFTINRVPQKVGDSVFYLEVTIYNHISDDNCEYEITIKEKGTDIYVSEPVNFFYGTPAKVSFISEYYETDKEYDIYIKRYCTNCEDNSSSYITDILKEEVVCENDIDITAWEIKKIGDSYYLLLDNVLTTDKYELCAVVNDTDFNNCTPTGNTIRNGKVAFILYKFSPNLPYKFNVRKKCAEGVFSEWVSFEKEATLPLPPIGGCSFSGFEIVEVGDTFITIKINNFHEGYNYELIYNHTNNYLLNVLVNVTTEYYTLTGLTPETLYHLTMRRKCGVNTISFQFIKDVTTVENEIECGDFNVLVGLETIETVFHNLVISIVDNQEGCDYVINALNIETGMYHSTTLVPPNKSFTIENVKNKDVFDIQVKKVCEGCDKEHSNIMYEVVIDDDNGPAPIIGESCDISITKTNETNSSFTIKINGYKPACTYNLYGILGDGVGALLAIIISEFTTFNKYGFVVEGITSFYVGYNGSCGNCEKEISNTIIITL